MLVVLITAFALDQWVWCPFWGSLGLLFMLERLVGVWRSDLRAKVVAMTLVPELVYATVLNVVSLEGVVDILLARQASSATSCGTPTARPRLPGPSAVLRRTG